MEIRLRSITSGDLDFMWKLHNEALREYVEKTWGWDDERQRGYVAEIVDSKEGNVVVVDGEDAGVWYVIEYEDEILLNSIRLLPEFQRRGVGTQLITQLLGRHDKPVRLQVLKVNPARSLYERLGFEVFGETETHYKMINPTPRRSFPATGHTDKKY